MKLWKSLKISIGSRSDPKSYSQELPQWGGQGYELDVFKSQTSLSTDSGLCTERGLRRTHIELIKPPGKRIGLKLAGPRLRSVAGSHHVTPDARGVSGGGWDVRFSPSHAPPPPSLQRKSGSQCSGGNNLGLKYTQSSLTTLLNYFSVFCPF